VAFLHFQAFVSRAGYFYIQPQPNQRGCDMSTKLNGKWWYQSFCPLAAVVDNETTPPLVSVPAQIAGPWTPASIMELKTDENGKVTGTAKLGPIDFTISGSVTHAIDKIPEGIELVVVVEKFSAVYNLRGFFLANSDHIIGTVVAINNDLGWQPVGTSGPFVMFPAKS
jgi:hypothetical protein